MRIPAALLFPVPGRAIVAGYDVVERPIAVRVPIGLTGQYAAVDLIPTRRQSLEPAGLLASGVAFSRRRTARRRAQTSQRLQQELDPQASPADSPWHGFPPMSARELRNPRASPGGTPEPADADLLGTLARECMEESQVRVSDAVPVGYQLVEEDREVYAQVRMAGLISELCPVAADPCTGRAYRRLMVAPLQARDLLGWGPRGEAQFAAATALAGERWGLALAPGAPQEYVD